jgi:hypothetical protein
MKMKSLKLAVVLLFAAALFLPPTFNRIAHSQGKGQLQQPPTGQANVAATDEDFRRCVVQDETPNCEACPLPTEAPAGFDNQPVPGFFSANPQKNQQVFGRARARLQRAGVLRVSPESRDRLGQPD